MPTQHVDVYRIISKILHSAWLALFYATLGTNIAQAAENPASNASATPALVVPANEATKETAPISEEKKQADKSILSTDNAADDGSLAGDFLSSYVAHSQGDVGSAVKFLKESVEKDPANTTLSGQLLILQLMHGDVADAVVTAKKLAKNKDHELIVDLLLAVDATKRKDLPAAAAQLKQAKSNSFDHIWLPLLSAWLEPNQKTMLPPEKILGEKNAVPSFIYYHVALINDVNGFKADAKKQLQASIKDLSRSPFRALFAYTKNRASENDRETIQQLLVDLDKQRPDMAALLRRELPYLTNLTDATELPKDALVSNAQEGIAEVLLTMASMLYTLDASQDIPLYLQLALYLKPDFPTAQLMLGNYYETLELFPEALTEYQKIRPSSPLYVKAGIRRAYIAEMQKKSEKSEEILNSFIKQFPDSLELITAYADMLRNRAAYTQAIPYYDKAISLAVNIPPQEQWALYFARGACYERIKDFPHAEADLKKALELAPNQYEVMNYLGYMWLDQDKNIDQAVKYIQQAYDANPNQPHIIDSLGWAYVQTGKLEEGIALLENAAELLPNDTTINEHLGDAYWFADRQLEAKFQWQRALTYIEDENNRPALQAKIDKGISAYSFHTVDVKTDDADNKSNAADNAVMPADATGSSGNMEKTEPQKTDATPKI